MSKMSKAIAVLGVVAGLGVAALPLSSYAADIPGSPKDVTITTTVPSSLSMSVDKTTVDLGTLNTSSTVSGQKVAVTVAGNASPEYSLTIMGKDGNTALTNTSDSTATIPAFTGTMAALDSGADGWGYKVGAGSWRGVPATATAVNTGSWGAGDTTAYKSTTEIEFGATSSATLKAGTYTGAVTLTASSV